MTMANEITIESIEELLEKLFPKGLCNERGGAIVLFAYFNMLIQEKDAKIEEAIKTLEFIVANDECQCSSIACVVCRAKKSLLKIKESRCEQT